MFQITPDGKKIQSHWHLYTFADKYNNKVLKLTGSLAKGMVIDAITAAFFAIKPLHVLGIKVKDDDIRK